MDGEETFALEWLKTNDIYEAINPSFIEETRLRKMSFVDKGKGKVVKDDDDVEEEDVNEERFQQELLKAKMISRLQTSLPEGEPSTRFEKEDGLYEEELVDFEPTPPRSPTVVLSEIEEEGEAIVSGFVVGLDAVGGNVEAPTCTFGELAVETTITLLKSGTEKFLEDA